MSDVTSLVERAAALLDRIEALLPVPPATPDWSAPAFRWRKQGTRGYLQTLTQPDCPALDDLLCLDLQKEEILRNTGRFVSGHSANNALLWGSRGTGKSTLIKAVLTEFHDRGLRLIEVEKGDLVDLPDILELLRRRPERFLVFCDDLSFESGESGYKTLKATLDGSLCATPDNLLIYATSNRRHLMPEPMHDNRQTSVVDGEIHPGEGVEEKVSLSDRFGLWVPFHPFSQEQYLGIVHHWLRRLGIDPESHGDAQGAALQWALRRGSRSGRTARQFALDWAGRVD